MWNRENFAWISSCLLFLWKIHQSVYRYTHLRIEMTNCEVLNFIALKTANILLLLHWISSLDFSNKFHIIYKCIFVFVSLQMPHRSRYICFLSINYERAKNSIHQRAYPFNEFNYVMKCMKTFKFVRCISMCLCV